MLHGLLNRYIPGTDEEIKAASHALIVNIQPDSPYLFS
jgi:hypothetical protein